MKQIPAATLIGIDEQTGAILEGGSAQSGVWTVYGAGEVTLYRGGQPKVHVRGESFIL